MAFNFESNGRAKAKCITGGTLFVIGAISEAIYLSLSPQHPLKVLPATLIGMLVIVGFVIAISGLYSAYNANKENLEGSVISKRPTKQ